MSPKVDPTTVTPKDSALFPPPVNNDQAEYPGIPKHFGARLHDV